MIRSRRPTWVVLAVSALAGCASVLGLPDEYSGSDGTGGSGAQGGPDASASDGSDDQDGAADDATDSESGSGGTGGGTGGTSGTGGAGGAPPTGNILGIEAGMRAACAIVKSGTTSHVYCWGRCEDGLLTRPCESGGELVTEPQRIELDTQNAPLTDVKALAMAEHTTCALKNDTTVWCWGSCANGEVGNPSCTGSAPHPKQVEASGGGALTDIKHLAGGGNTFCASTSAGVVLCWGVNPLNPSQSDDAAVQSQSFVDITSMAVGSGHVCVVATGQVTCWGANNANQASGVPVDGGDFVQPVQVVLAASALEVAAGYEHTCALLNSGTIACWGAWHHEATAASEPSIVQLPTSKPLSTMQAVTATYWGTCATSAGGKVYCWGSRAGLWLGPPHTANADAEPDAVIAAGTSGIPLVGMDRVRGGALFGCASSDAVYCWGDLGYDPVGYACVPDGGPVDLPCAPEATKVEGLPTN